MPIKIRWSSKDYLPSGLMLFGFCGLFQVLFIFIAQYLLSIGNYLVIVLIPVGVTLALFYGAVIIFESYAEAERRTRLKSQFRKRRIKNQRLYQFLAIPIVKPLLIIFGIFSGLFFLSYVIAVAFLDNILSFILAENIATFICLLVANYIEKSHGRIQRL